MKILDWQISLTDLPFDDKELEIIDGHPVAAPRPSLSDALREVSPD
jgi:hypothetical protein